MTINPKESTVTKKNTKPTDHLLPIFMLLSNDPTPLTLADAMATCGNKSPTDDQRKVAMEMISEDKRFHIEGSNLGALISLALSPTNATDPARAAIAAEVKAKGKPDAFLDRAVEWVKGQQAAINEAFAVSVDTLLKEVYETKANAAAVLGFLKQAKADGRLTITSRDGKNYLSLGEMVLYVEKPATQAELNALCDEANGIEPAKVEETKTVEQHLKDAQGRRTCLGFPHGPGVWVAYLEPTPAAPGHLPKPPQPAQIKNMHTQGNVTLYDLKLESGKVHKEVPAWMIERLSPAESQRIADHQKLVQFEKHLALGKELSELLAQEQAVEVEQSEELKKTRKRIDALQEKINKHPYNLIAGDQTTIDLNGEDDGAGSIKSVHNKTAENNTAAAVVEPAKPTTPAERLMARITGKDTLELTGDNQPWDKLEAATLKAVDSTGKPPTVKPLAIDQAPGKWIAVDVQNGTVVLLRAYPRDEWRKLFEEKFGEPRDIPSQALTAKAEAGGQWIGFPVKVGRATLHLAPLDDALLLSMPAAAAQA